VCVWVVVNDVAWELVDRRFRVRKRKKKKGPRRGWREVWVYKRVILKSRGKNRWKRDIHIWKEGRGKKSGKKKTAYFIFKSWGKQMKCGGEEGVVGLPIWGARHVVRP
jgi:hypothetical protein